MSDDVLKIVCGHSDTDKVRLAKVARYIAVRDETVFFDFSTLDEIYEKFLDENFDVDTELEDIDPAPTTSTPVSKLRTN